MWGVCKLRRLHFPAKQRQQTSLGKEEMGFVWFTPKADVQVGPCYSQCNLTSQFEFSTLMCLLIYLFTCPCVYLGADGITRVFGA